jgi:gas vesicle protein GvpA/GvpJ/GvpM family
MKRRPARLTHRQPSTVPRAKPPKHRRGAAPARPHYPPAPRGTAPRQGPPRHQVARIVDVSDKSLADVLDSLLNKGVVLNADVILALANVDLIYVRLSALICAADRLTGEKP